MVWNVSQTPLAVDTKEGKIATKPAKKYIKSTDALGTAEEDEKGLLSGQDIAQEKDYRNGDHANKSIGSTVAGNNYTSQTIYTIQQPT